jgi:trimethylamine--corrinoid protein Co-methyltransferase
MKAGINKTSGFGLNAFTQNELESIHYATLRILGETGIKVEHEEALEIFHGAGADVEKHGSYGVVKLASHIVEDCIRWAPSAVTYYGRRPEDDYTPDSKSVGFAASYGEQVNVIDLETRQLRPAVKEDNAVISRLTDYFDEIVVNERAACSTDQMPETQPLHNFEAMVSNTSKHNFLYFGSKENTQRIIEMGCACVGGEENFKKRPIVSANVCPTSPLTLVHTCCEGIIECARRDVGLMMIPMAIAGATAPMSLAGTLVKHNAEVLSAIILVQLVKKGTPCTYGGCSTVMDMKLGSAPIGIPEQGLLSVAAAKLAQYYKLPSWVGGGASDSKVPDAQSAYDFSLNALAAALAGANIIYGLGSLESALTFDYASLIMDVEQCKRIMSMVGGIEINDETLAVDLIQEIGFSSQYMEHEHTLNNMRSFNNSSLFDCGSRNYWQESMKGKDLTERAYEKVRHIIKTHKPMPLADGAAETMSTIIEEYESGIKSNRK